MAEIPSNIDFVTAANQQDIRVMIVDDSVVARTVLGRMLAAEAGICVACSVASTDKALAYLVDQSVDIILLDVELPGRSGLDALPDLLAASGDARIMIVSSFAERNGAAAVNALSLGACDTLAKPGITNYHGDFARKLREKVVRLGRNPERRSKPEQAGKPTKKISTNIKMPECIAIGASTGGIPAIYKILENLDASIDCPIFITQHLPAAFMGFFARQLASISGRNVEIAGVGAKIARNTIYLAPGDAHLQLELQSKAPVVARATPGSPSRYCPSVDVMLESLTAVYGSKMLAIVLSGMGNDGAKSAEAVVRNGGKILVQDRASSVVWGMPGAIARQGIATAVLNPDEMVQKLNKMAAAKC